MAYLRNISLKNISVIHDNDDIEVECIPLNGAVKVKGSDTEQLKNATTILKKELFYNMYEKSLKYQLLKTKLDMLYLNIIVIIMMMMTRMMIIIIIITRRKRMLMITIRITNHPVYKKVNSGHFLRNELDKDVEKVFEQYETIAVFDSVDEIKHNTLNW